MRRIISRSPGAPTLNWALGTIGKPIEGTCISPLGPWVKSLTTPSKVESRHPKGAGEIPARGDAQNGQSTKLHRVTGFQFAKAVPDFVWRRRPDNAVRRGLGLGCRRRLFEFSWRFKTKNNHPRRLNKVQSLWVPNGEIVGWIKFGSVKNAPGFLRVGNPTD